jgi:hypothetical protein
MNAALLVMKGVISDLSQEDQEKIKNTADELRQIINRDRDHGVLALTIVALEEQEKAE